MKKSSAQSGNMFFYILLAIVLVGALTVALRDNSGLSGDIDKESLALKANQVLLSSNQLEKAVQIILQNGSSETAIKFDQVGSSAIATTPEAQVFSGKGGMAKISVPSNIGTGAAWGYSAALALPGVGSDKADLVGSLYNISAQFCSALNTKVGISTTPTTACSTSTAFNGTYPTSPYILDKSVFPTVPAPRFCVYCSNRSQYVYFTTLIER